MNLRNLVGKIRGYYFKLKYQLILRKAKIGSNFYAFCKLDISGPGIIKIGDNCMIFSTVFRNDYVTLYTHDQKAVIILHDQIILRGTRMGCFSSIDIGSRSVIEGASIFDSDFHNINAYKRDIDFKEFNKPVKIEEKCYIGTESLIGKGAVIGANSIILPGSSISKKNIKPGSIVCGLPGRVINGT